VLKADNLPPSCAVVTKSGSLNFLELPRPLQACNGTAFYTEMHGQQNIKTSFLVCKTPSLAAVLNDRLNQAHVYSEYFNTYLRVEIVDVDKNNLIRTVASIPNLICS